MADSASGLVRKIYRRASDLPRRGVMSALASRPQGIMQTTLRVPAVCVFLAAILLTGLGAVFITKLGTGYLEQQHSDSQTDGWKGSIKEAQRARKSLLTGRGGHKAQLTKDEFVVAVVTDLGHEDFVEYSRVWRQGVKTFVATNHTVTSGAKERLVSKHNEHWGFYPDDSPLHTLALKGDSRAALAPFLAFRELGDTFKWLFYGDDDTYFFMDAAASVLHGLDPDVPYFVTDHMWWTEKWTEQSGQLREETHHPHRGAPLCVPCSYNGPPQPKPRGCPCTPQAICQADLKGIFFKPSSGQCGMPRVPIRTFSMHGGAGAALSIGLFRTIVFEDFERCVTTTYSTGGDALISICLWQAGFWMTDPDPSWHPEGLHRFDLGGIAQDDGEEIVPRVARLMGNALLAAAGGCASDPCRLELDNFVTLHMRGRKFPSRRAHSEISRLLAELADLAHGRSEDWTLTVEDPTQKEVDTLVAIALQKLREWRRCQAQSSEPKKRACLKELQTMSDTGGFDFHTSLRNTREDLVARDMADHIIRSIFERHPSPSGSYGDIPVGRE